MTEIAPRVLTALEFTKIRERLAGHAASRLGRAQIEGLTPSTDPAEVAERLADTAEAVLASRGADSIPLGGIHDLSTSLLRAEKGSLLDPLEFLQIGDTLAAGNRLRRFFAVRREECPRLAEASVRLPNLPELQNEIARAISDEGEVRDEASPELRRIRRSLVTKQEQIRSTLERMVHSARYRAVLQEPIVTMRGDRYVLPVKQEARSEIKGVVHDQSSSGATLFIEPMAVVELNNELRRLTAQEAAEVERILRRLGSLVAAHVAELRQGLASLAHLDLVAAKARLALEMDAHRPDLNSDGRISLRRARHPLLRGDVVPIDVELGRNFTSLVITGPNTGGKTVTLKTIGLLTLMAQGGLFVPAASGSELAVFPQVFCDIGDEQSIEQSLSTFSGHMTNIVEIVRNIKAGDLVLLDELGAGTDPAEGAALAMALLDHLVGVGARTVATTHYSELKTFAYSRPEIENASVEFDVETLSPTYRLVLGLPGRSNAFEISRRLGLPEELIDGAKSFLSREVQNVEALIADMSEERNRLARARFEAEAAQGIARQQQEEANRRLEQLRQKEEELLADARQRAAGILQRAKVEADEVIRELRSLLLEGEASAEVLREAEQTRQRLNEARSGIEAFEPQTQLPAPAARQGRAHWRAGEDVYVRSLRQEGQVVGEVADGQVAVQVGIMRVTVPGSDLEERSPRGRRETRREAENVQISKARTLSPELDLRGEMAEDALERLDKYLDDARLAGLPQVRLIHGKGTGALRQAVRRYLETARGIEDWRLGGPGEGGDGVTIVKLG